MIRIHQVDMGGDDYGLVEERPVSTLYERLVAELDHALRARGRDEMVAAVRAVVELHKPVTFWRPWAGEPPCCTVCAEHPLWPCSTIRTLAEALGVSVEGEDHG